MRILATVLPIFLALGLGILCRRAGILTRDGVAALKKVAVNITLPVVSLSAFAQVAYTRYTIFISAWIFLCCLLALAAGMLIAKVFGGRNRIMPYLCTGFEGGMLGFALYPLLYGTNAPFALVDLGQVLFVFSVYKLLLSGAREARSLLREAVRSPSIWALTIGIIIGSTGLYARLQSSELLIVWEKTTSFISAPTSFLVLLCVGYDLRLNKIDWCKSGIAILGRSAIMAALFGVTMLLNQPIFGGQIKTSAALMLFIMPAPFVLGVFSDQSEEQNYISSTLSMMTLLTLLCLPWMTGLS